MRKLIAAAVAVGALGGVPGSAAGATVTQSGVAPPGTVIEISLGSSAQIYLFGLTTGPDGNLWFADQGCMGLGHCAIGRIGSDGRVTTFEHGLTAGSLPDTIVTGSDGNLWFTDDGRQPAIGRITPAGRITEFSRGLGRGSQPFELTLAPDGNVWFTDQGRRPAIGRITPRGRISEFSRGLPRGSVPFGIAAGTGGQVWFTDRGCSRSGRCAVGRIALASGQIAELHRGLRLGGQPLGIAAGAGGEMWFADATGAIGQVSPAGQIGELTRGLRAGSSPVAVAAGPDGNMWFTDEGQTAAVGRVTRAGAIREFFAGVPAGSEPAAIAPAADGRVWFTDEGSAAAFGSVATGMSPAGRVPPRIVGSPRVGAPISCQAGRFATWAGLAPSVNAFRFDGVRWLRNGVLLRGHASRSFTPAGRDSGARLACRETVTYPPPLSVTVSVTSPAVQVQGVPAAAATTLSLIA